jgi:DNA helicase II / ATP-dependent DNA helicase PcrA
MISGYRRIERHGEPPEILGFRTGREEFDHLRQMVEAFPGSGYNTAGIICKTQRQAEKLHQALQEAGLDVHLLTPETRDFRPGVTVCTAHLAKGLEFDQVVVPGASAGNYRTAMDRSLLYVACTRAMHRLALTFAGERTPLIDPPATTAEAAGGYSGTTNP